MMSWGWPSLYVFSIRKSNVKRNICTKPFLELLKSNLVCQPTCFCTSTLCGTWTLCKIGKEIIFIIFIRRTWIVDNVVSVRIKTENWIVKHLQRRVRQQGKHCWCCTMHCVLCSMYYILCTMHIVHCTMYYVICTMYYATDFSTIFRQQSRAAPECTVDQHFNKEDLSSLGNGK